MDTSRVIFLSEDSHSTASRAPRRAPRRHGGVSKALVGVSALCMSAALVGCGGPTKLVLSAPPPTAPLEARLEAYQQLQPVGAEIHSYYKKSRDGMSERFLSSRAAYIRLGGGEEVHYPEELLPLVPRNSPTARSILQSQEYRATSVSFRRWALASAGVGFLGGVVGLSSAMDLDPGTPRTVALVSVGTIAGALLLGGLGMYVVSGYNNSQAEEHRANAFRTYEPDLRKRLNLCPRGEELVDCSAAP